MAAVFLVPLAALILPSPGENPPSRARPLGMEQLETRLAPATFTWTGLGGNNFWSTPKNWLDQNGVATAPSGLPSGSLDDLVFPGGVSNTNTVNDLGSDTSPATFGSITIGGSNYVLSQNAIILGSQLGGGQRVRERQRRLDRRRDQV